MSDNTKQKMAWIAYATFSLSIISLGASGVWYLAGMANDARGLRDEVRGIRAASQSQPASADDRAVVRWRTRQRLNL